MSPEVREKSVCVCVCLCVCVCVCVLYCTVLGAAWKPLAGSSSSSFCLMNHKQGVCVGYDFLCFNIFIQMMMIVSWRIWFFLWSQNLFMGSKWTWRWNIPFLLFMASDLSQERLSKERSSLNTCWWALVSGRIFWNSAAWCSYTEYKKINEMWFHWFVEMFSQADVEERATDFWVVCNHTSRASPSHNESARALEQVDCHRSSSLPWRIIMVYFNLILILVGLVCVSLPDPAERSNWQLTFILY